MKREKQVGAEVGQAQIMTYFLQSKIINYEEIKHAVAEIGQAQIIVLMYDLERVMYIYDSKFIV